MAAKGKGRMRRDIRSLPRSGFGDAGACTSSEERLGGDVGKEIFYGRCAGVQRRNMGKKRGIDGGF